MTPSVSRPDDHSRIETVSSLSAVRKTSSPPAAATGAISGRMTSRSRSKSPAPAISAASSRL